MNKFKCIIWDLDNTLWNGILIEKKDVIISEEMISIIHELDKRGIIQSIASRNNFENVNRILTKYNIEKFFLYPQINWSPKSESLKKISENLHISYESMVLIDDDPFEREEVKYSIPSITCLDAKYKKKILSDKRFIPTYINSDSISRREYYLNEQQRKKVEMNFKGSNSDFLNSLNMEVNIFLAREKDINRIQELTIRTHQLNSTGYTYSRKKISEMIISKDFDVFIVSLSDKFGSYGNIGLIITENDGKNYIIRLFLLSCRILNRGVSGPLLYYISNYYYKKGYNIFAEFKNNGKNRQMLITFLLNGYKEVVSEAGIIKLLYSNSDKTFNHIQKIRFVEKNGKK